MDSTLSQLWNMESGHLRSGHVCWSACDTRVFDCQEKVKWVTLIKDPKQGEAGKRQSTEAEAAVSKQKSRRLGSWWTPTGGGLVSVPGCTGLIVN